MALGAGENVVKQQDSRQEADGEEAEESQKNVSVEAEPEKKVRTGNCINVTHFISSRYALTGKSNLFG